jgi:ABC-type amino acid transport system permease subunit
MPSRLHPAIWGGLLIGVLSALPFVSALNACCCLWVITGGMLTSYLLQERASVPITAGDGAITGLLAGAIGAVLAGVLGLLFGLVQGIGGPESIEQMLGQGDFPPEIARVLEQVRDLPPAVFYLGPLLLFLFIFPIFGMLGGLLGVAIFRRTPPPPPPGTVEVLPPEPPRL